MLLEAGAGLLLDLSRDQKPDRLHRTASSSHLSPSQPQSIPEPPHGLEEGRLGGPTEMPAAPAISENFMPSYALRTRTCLCEAASP